MNLFAEPAITESGSIGSNIIISINISGERRRIDIHYPAVVISNRYIIPFPDIERFTETGKPDNHRLFRINILIEINIIIVISASIEIGKRIFRPGYRPSPTDI